MTSGPSAADGGGLVTVAVRELHDYCYRAFRTGGVEPGEAEALTAATVFATTHLGRALERPLGILEADGVATLGLPYILRAEVSAEEVSVPAGSVVGDFAYFAADALTRGTVIGSIAPDGVRTSALEWFDGCDPELAVQHLTTITPEGGQLARVLEALADTSKMFRRSGIEVSQDDWRRLEGLAQRYLVSESAIDTAIRDIAT